MASLADFRLRFKEFSEVEDEKVQMALDDTALIMKSPARWLSFYDTAHVFFAAHFVTTSEATESGDTSALSPISKQEVDDVVIESAVSSVSPNFDELYSTSYGKRYAMYRRMVFVGIRGV